MSNPYDYPSPANVPPPPHRPPPPPPPNRTPLLLAILLGLIVGWALYRLIDDWRARGERGAARGDGTRGPGRGREGDHPVVRERLALRGVHHQPGRATRLLRAGRRPHSERGGLGLRVGPERPHRHQLPRGGRPAWQRDVPGHVGRPRLVSRPADRSRPRKRSGGAEDRGPRQQPSPDPHRHLARPEVGQKVFAIGKPFGWTKVSPPACSARGPADPDRRRPGDQGRDPDRRRHQPRQFRRSLAGQRGRLIGVNTRSTAPRGPASASVLHPWRTRSTGWCPNSSPTAR